MKRFHFYYSMREDYSEEVSRCYFTIKCVPRTDARQRIEAMKFAFVPGASWQTGRDAFGNDQLWGVCDTPHTRYEFHTEGQAVTGLADYEEEADGSQLPLFRVPHGLNVPGPSILAYHRNWMEELSQAGSPMAKALLLTHALHRDLVYTPASTTMDTTAEEAMAQGRGVCQDYAHILISLLHLEKIPARYVTGMIPGEGASHAWVEVLQDGRWYGVDPTNDGTAAEDHIRIGVGRDARDCMINRGILFGGGRHTQKVLVRVTELTEASLAREA